MSTYETTIENENEEEIEIEVDFDFSPAEKMTHDYPGCDASVDINYVETVDGKEVKLTKEAEELMAEEILWSADHEERWDY